MVQRPSPAARLQSSEASASSSPVGVTPSDSSEEDGPRRGWAERCEAGEEKVGCESDDDDEEEEDYDYDLPAGPLLRSGRERREDVYELGGRSRMQEGARRGHRLDGRWDDGAREDGGESADGLEKGGEDGDLEGAMAYTAEEERGVVRKFDRRLVLFVALLYLLSFLDRSSMSPFACFILSFLSCCLLLLPALAVCLVVCLFVSTFRCSCILSSPCSSFCTPSAVHYHVA